MRRLALSFGALALAACGPNVRKLSVSPASMTLVAKGEKGTFRATPRDDIDMPITDPKVKPRWTSTDPLVATVDQDGRVTAQSSGEAFIVAGIGDVKRSVRVVVAIPAAIALDPATLELAAVGHTGTLAVSVADDLGRALPMPSAVAWTSSDPAVARVDGGRVTAVAPGAAAVTAAIGAVRATAEVVVKSPNFAKLVVRPSRHAFGAAGELARLEALALDAKGARVAGVPVTWSSSDASVAAVRPDGTVVAVKQGTARITASAGKKTASAEVSVAE